MSEQPTSLPVALGGGITAELPLQWIDDTTGIYSFVLLSHVDWVRAAATSLVEMIDDALDGECVDVILTPEAKAITLAYEVAVRLSLTSFVVARKSAKNYMSNPVGVDVKSITTKGLQRLWFGEEDLALLRGKRILLIDDVVSTGATLEAMFSFLKSHGCEVALVACVLTEGQEWKEFDGVPVVSIAHIPLARR
jgi:adenine phosphoribosyltransferase